MSIQTDDRVASLTSLFATYDRGDIDGFLEYLAPDVSLRFGNAEPIHGRQAIKESLQEFSKLFNWIRHDHVETWRAPDGAAVEADVTYERTDGREVHVPAVTICRFDERGLINDYRIFIDLAPLFAD
jgi:ketosteroid isomerase-like protein